MSIETRQPAHEKCFEFPVNRQSMPDLAKKIELTYDRMGYRSLAAVYCETDGHRVILKGETATFYLKQVAQVIATKVAGVGSIINQIKVAG
jgi:osmotically-inducible protein OsmY